jgi:pyrroloquinoline quinone (PQQ) biosynthesis protein C
MVKLKKAVAVERVEDTVLLLTYLGKGLRVTLRSSALAEPILSALALGHELPGDVAGAAGAVLERLEPVLKAHHLLAVDARDLEGAVFDGEWLYRVHREHAAYWLDRVYDHPFWSLVGSGQASFSQILGFALEKYHYIEAAHEHMAYAASSDFSAALQPHLARHFLEEYTHGNIYRRGLAHFFPDEAIITSIPLPTTRALVNYLNELAHGDTFAYYAANEVLQMTENGDGSDGPAELDRLMLQHYPESKPLVEAFNAHTRLDQGLEHQDAFLLMCKDQPALTARAVRGALAAAERIAEYLTLFLDGIQRHYAAPPHGLTFRASIASELGHA